jgi:hypothetical protein
MTDGALLATTLLAGDRPRLNMAMLKRLVLVGYFDLTVHLPPRQHRVGSSSARLPTS